MQKSWALAFIVGLTFFGVSTSAEAQTTVTESGDNFGPPAYIYRTPLSAGTSVKFVGKMSSSRSPTDYGDEVRFTVSSSGTVYFTQSGPQKAFVRVFRLNSDGKKSFLNTNPTTSNLYGTLSSGTYGIEFSLNSRDTNYVMTVRR